MTVQQMPHSQTVRDTMQSRLQSRSLRPAKAQGTDTDLPSSIVQGVEVPCAEAGAPLRQVARRPLPRLQTPDGVTESTESGQ